MGVPASAPVWLRELDSERGELTLERAVPKLRDEITGVMMDRHRGSSRPLAMALARLDEAHHWITAYLQEQGTLVMVPRAEILQKAFPTPTDKTDETVTPNA